LKRFSSARIVVVGDLLADHYVFGQTERVSREAPVLIVRHEEEEVRLGGGANAAANARALGAEVTVIGALGNDEMGRRMRRLFRTAGVELRACGGKGIVTETKTRILAGGASTTRQQMLRIDRGGSGVLPARVRSGLAEAVCQSSRNADAVIVSDYGSGVLCSETRAALRDVMRRGIPVCVDSRFSLSDYVGFTVCKPNEPELAALAGKPVRGEAEFLEASTVVRRRLDCRVLLVTRGRKGMAIFERRREPKFLAVHGQAEAVDVTGAGDTVIAAFALALGIGARPEVAAEIANVAGALVVQKQGTATVSLAELIEEFHP
jgi:rfaE bifunctional protein kinase chain/domain